MKHTLKSLLIGLCLATLAQAVTPTVEEQIKVFQEKASAVLEKRALQANPDQRNNYSIYASGALTQLSLRWQTNPASQEFEQAVTQVVTATGNDTDVLKAANDLLSAVKADRDERIAAFRTELKTLLARTGEACLAAKTPADLDKALENLTAYRETNYANQRQIDPAGWQRGASAHRFVTRWQDYLMEINSRRENRSDRITSVLNDLANMADPELMPRSRILALMPASTAPGQTSTPPVDPGPQISDILKKTVKLSDLGDAIEQLRKLRGGSYNQPIDEVITVLNSLVEIQGRITEGTLSLTSFQETNSRLTSSSRLSPEDREAISRLRRALFLSAAGAYLKNAAGAPQADDSIESYIERSAAYAAKKDDWQLARSALEIYRGILGNISSATPQWVTSDFDSIGIYISARNQEQAGLYAQAIASYQRVLRGSGKLIPVADIAKRLDALRKSQPAAFEEAARIPEPSVASYPVRYSQQSLPRDIQDQMAIRPSQPARQSQPAQSMPVIPAPSPAESAPVPSQPVAKEAPPATAALIRKNLSQLYAAADQYFLEKGVSEVSASLLYGPGKDKYIRELKSIAGEDYSKIVFKSGVPSVSVTTSNGEVVTCMAP